MRVQIKLAFLMIVLVALLCGIFTFYNRNENSKLILLANSEKKEKNLVFDEILKLKESPLETPCRSLRAGGQIVEAVTPREEASPGSELVRAGSAPCVPSSSTVAVS